MVEEQLDLLATHSRDIIQINRISPGSARRYPYPDCGVITCRMYILCNTLVLGWLLNHISPPRRARVRVMYKYCRCTTARFDDGWDRIVPACLRQQDSRSPTIIVAIVSAGLIMAYTFVPWRTSVKLGRPCLYIQIFLVPARLQSSCRLAKQKLVSCSQIQSGVQ